MSTINLRPRRPALDAREMDSLVEAYLADAARRVAPVTLDSYRFALSVFLRWWSDRGPQQNWCMQRADLHDFAHHLECACSCQSGQPYTYHTRHVILARIRQLLRWAADAENSFIDRDYSSWVPTAAGSPAKRQVLSIAHLARLIRVAGESGKPTRDKAIIALLAGTGIRRAECVGLDVQDITWNADGSGKLHVRRGKGGKARYVLFDRPTGAYLRAYLNATGAQFGPLWRGHGNRRLGLKGFYGVVKNTAARAGLEDYIDGPHDLRRLFATTWTKGRKAAAYAKPLSEQLGHTSERMTLRYILTDLDDVKEVFLSPLSFLEKVTVLLVVALNFTVTTVVAF